MQQTLEPTLDVVAKAKGEFESGSQRMLHLLSFVPDEKLTWAPSATAKSALRIAAHSALSSQFFAKVITGDMPETMPSPDEFFRKLRADEDKFTTRTAVFALLNESSSELSHAIDTVNAANVDSTPNSPFGPIPMQFWLQQCCEHMINHTGQLAYLQTIWGDLDNYMG